jgi:predicted metal-dependent phosphoesterase TrpH
MKHACDQHIHTYYSDGRASPAEMLHHAVIADHDNAQEAHEALPMAEELGLEARYIRHIETLQR